MDFERLSRHYANKSCSAVRIYFLFQKNIAGKPTAVRVSLDGNFWWGGATTLNGPRNPKTRQTSSRLGGMAAFRVSKHQSIKVSYSRGTYIRFGGNRTKCCHSLVVFLAR